MAFLDETGLVEVWRLTEDRADGKIGDTLTTMRTDFGEEFLLCNGEVVSVLKYPKLVELLKQNFTLEDFRIADVWGSTSSGISYAPVYCIAYANDYWVIGGYYYDGSTRYARIAYATDLNGEWTIKDLWSGASSALINCITYANGYWVVGGKRAPGSSMSAYIAYTTDPAGEWTTKEVWYTSGTSEIHSITYADGYWAVAGVRSTNSTGEACVAYTTDLTGSWARKAVWDHSSSAGAYCIAYANGYWVVGGYYGPSLSTYYGRISYATSLIGEWKTKYLWSSSKASSSIPVACVAYANGYWVVGGTSCGGENKYYASVAYTTDPAGEWTIQDLWGGSSSNANRVYSIAYADDRWVVGGRDVANDCAKTASATNPAGAWTENVTWNGGGIMCVAYANEQLIVGGFHNSDSYYARIAMQTENARLPVISGDVYTYIKALEE